MLDVEIDAFQEWVSIPAEELIDRSPLPLTIVPTKEDLYEHFAQDMFARMSESRAQDEQLSLIIPIGPKRHFPRVSELINGAGLSLAHVTFFGMDEWLDWQGRPVDWDHPCRLEAYFANNFLNLIEPELRPPPRKHHLSFAIRYRPPCERDGQATSS